MVDVAPLAVVDMGPLAVIGEESRGLCVHRGGIDLQIPHGQHGWQALFLLDALLAADLDEDQQTQHVEPAQGPVSLRLR